MHHCGVNRHVTHVSYRSGHKQLVPSRPLDLDEAVCFATDVDVAGCLMLVLCWLLEILVSSISDLTLEILCSPSNQYALVTAVA